MSQSEAPLRILAVSLRYPPYVAGGYEQVTALALAGLAARGHQVELLCGRGRRFERGAPGLAMHAELEPGLEDAAGQPLDLFALAERAGNLQRCGLHLLSPHNYRATRRALSSSRAEVLLAFNLGLVSWSPLLAARIAQVPTVAWIGDAWPANQWLLDWRSSASRRAHKPERLAWLERVARAIREGVEPGELLVISRFLAKALEDAGLRPERMHILGAALAPHMQRRAQAVEPASRGRGEALRVLCTSMQWHGKGQHVLLAAAARARQLGANLELDFAGQGPREYRAQLEQLASVEQLSGRVRFHGMLDGAALSALLARGHLFAVPALWPEPYGLATVEAMAHGLAVVASDAGGTREIARPGRDCCLVPAGEVEALAQVLVELERDEPRRQALAQSAREHALSAFEHERFLDRLEQTLWRAAGRQGAA